MVLLLAFAVGYLFGSVPFSWFAGHNAGVDLRRAGSGNVGAGNVGVLVGAAMAVVAFALDASKAVAAVLLTRSWGSAAAVAAGLGTVVGHGWPVWLRFVGGRSQTVTLAAGAMLAPLATLAVLPILGLGLVGRRLAVAWLVSLAVLPVLAFWLDGLAAGCFAVGAAVLGAVRRLRGSPMLAREPLGNVWRMRLIHDRDR